ncbi:MAG: DUF3987 domain-containing protein [Bacteroidota bacterium]
MSKKTFKPKDWVASNKQLPDNSAQNADSDIEIITKRIESSALDIAPSYADWRDLGFALAEALGESGRTYYHRLSRFYSNYESNETDKQYNACIKARGHGVTIKTLYHLAKSAGISVAIPTTPITTQTVISPLSPNPQSGESEEMGKMLPTFPAEIFDNLPDLLQSIVKKSNSSDDADLLLLGSLVVFSAALPNVYGIYGGREVFPNLFLFISAQASAGKGRLSLCRRLVEPIHQMLRQQAKNEYDQYQMKLSEYAASKGDKLNMEKPNEPPIRMLIIPANNSATGLFQLLKENDEKGLMFETEGDTLAQTFKSEHGNYSDGFRKAFHHETISYNRRKDREFVELAKPRLSALLSGTPKQITSLIPNAENGLFSRFMFYYMNIRPEWKDVFAGDNSQTLDQVFDQFGNQFFSLYKFLESQTQPFRFCFTVNQQKQFNDYFEQTQIQYLELCGSDYIGTVRRLGLITFRIAMIITALRIMDGGELRSPLVCSDIDFDISLVIVKTLVRHAAHVFQQLPTEQQAATTINTKLQLLEALPQQFDRQIYLTVAQRLNIPAKTAEKQIARFVRSGLLTHPAQNQYNKL